MANPMAKSALVAGLVFWAGASQSAEDLYATIQRECAAKLQMTSGGCDCIEAKARAELNDRELDLVVAHITEDRAGLVEKQNGLTPDEMMTVVNFLSGAPMECASR